MREQYKVKIEKKKKPEKKRLFITEAQQKTIKKVKDQEMPDHQKSVRGYLVDNNLYFHRNFYFKEMRHRNRFKLLFFDFYLPRLNLCIIFDDKYESEYKITEQNYFLMAVFCMKNNIRLLKIKHEEKDRLPEFMEDFMFAHYCKYEKYVPDNAE